jgi:hypothetical protein
MDASIDVGHVGALCDQQRPSVDAGVSDAASTVEVHRGARSAVRAAPSRVLAIAIVGGLRDSRAHLNADLLNLVPFTF